ncbi:MAG: hypothetical protein ABIG37_01880 [Nanoarchaeota archaeon]
MNKIYRNSTELMQLHGVPIYMNDMADACLRGRLNLFMILMLQEKTKDITKLYKDLIISKEK